MTIKSLCAAAGFALSAKLVAAPVVEKVDRLEVNWSALKVRYYGEATPAEMASEPDLKNAERKARSEGQSYAAQALKELGAPDLADQAAKAAQEASGAATSYNTTYFGDGSVRVYLEGSLPQARGSVVPFQGKTDGAAATTYTGIVLKLDKAAKPRASYQVVDENGGVLFAAADMSESAYRKNLMGRWFRRPSTSELTSAVGANPLVVEAAVQADGRFVVSKASWQQAAEANKPLLVNGQIALTLP